ncbi:class I SAM-dependent methyltransferase [Desulfovibrio aminophilus]|nr:class I SAM-dependent methyltransferase [Desulfovibrio aminophilus]MCM0754023.1 class I SAM-dependent methyltransferase [Desulfovibrio aminophilus]
MHSTADHHCAWDRCRRAGPAVLSLLSGLLRLGRPDSVASVLDDGCGGGALLRELASWPFLELDLAGVDSSPSMLRRAKASLADLPVALARADMAHLPFPSASFDAVVCVHSLHRCHALEPSPALRLSARRAAVAEAARVLRKGGTLVIVQSDIRQEEADPLWSRYFPAALKYKRAIRPRFRDIQRWMAEAGAPLEGVKPFHDRLARPLFRPELALDDAFLTLFSEFAFLGEEALAEGRDLLRRDLESGRLTAVLGDALRRYERLGGNITAHWGRRR